MLKNNKIFLFFSNYFPVITKENIIRRTFIFYILLYIFLFSIPLAIKEFSLLTFGTLAISLFFLMAHGLSFIASRQIPNFLLLFNLFKGFKLFMFIYVIFLMFTLISTVYIPNKIKILTILYLINFVIFPLMISFYYISRLLSGVKSKIIKEKQ